MLQDESDAKPAVLGWLNPNNTIHNNTGRVFGLGHNPTQTQKPASHLRGYATSKVSFLCFFLSRQRESRPISPSIRRPIQLFQQVFHLLFNNRIKQRTVIHVSWTGSSRAYENKIRLRRCPRCGKERPLDWFASKDGDRCWKCASLREEAEKDERKEKDDGLIG